MKQCTAYTICLLLVFSYAHAQQESFAVPPAPYTINTYHGEVITPETIVQLAPPLPARVKPKLEAWVTAHRDLLVELARTPQPLSSYAKKVKADKLLLQEYGLKSLSRTNYIIELPHMPYFVQICGPQNRYYILSYHNGIKNPHSPSHNLTASKIDQFEIVPTYKHISRVARYLRLSEYFQQLKL